ncbi:MAG: GntR family transcriptional regulator [Acidobacteria bacterium]|nr:GntR family transcriptional regulator [Acidobacteriota bacterium]
MELTQLKRQRATDEVYLALRQSILGHLFKPGERLQVDEIAHKLGVSLTPVRHAIQQLSAEGLIEIRPRSGTFVATLTARDVEETSDLRCALECLAGEKAVERITAEESARFHQLLAAMAEPILSEDDRKLHEENNSRFHRLLIDCSGNKRLAEAYEGLHAHLVIARAHSRDAGWEQRLAVEQAEHEEIVAALEARDLPRLTQALRTHILRGRLSMTQRL